MQTLTKDVANNSCISYLRVFFLSANAVMLYLTLICLSANFT